MALAKALLPEHETDIVPLFRDDTGFALVREVLSPLITDDFESVMVWPAVTRTHAGLDGFRENWKGRAMTNGYIISGKATSPG